METAPGFLLFFIQHAVYGERGYAGKGHKCVDGDVSLSTLFENAFGYSLFCGQRASLPAIYRVGYIAESMKTVVNII